MRWMALAWIMGAVAASEPPGSVPPPAAASCSSNAATIREAIRRVHASQKNVGLAVAVSMEESPCSPRTWATRTSRTRFR